jgi:hypothetical protein
MRSRVGEKSCGDKSLKNSFKIMESPRYNIYSLCNLRFKWLY